MTTDYEKVSMITDAIFDELGIGSKVKRTIKLFLSMPNNKGKLPAIYNRIVEIVNS